MGNTAQKSNTQFITEATERLKKIGAEARVVVQNNPFNGFARAIEKSCVEVIDKMDKAIKFRVPKDGDILSDVVDGKTIQSIVTSYLPQYRLPFPLITIECENAVFADHENFVEDNVEYKGTIALAWQTERENLNPILHLMILNKCRETPKSPFDWYLMPYKLDIDLECAKLKNTWNDFVKAKPLYPDVPMNNVFNDANHEVSMLVQFLIALSCKNVSMKKGFAPSMTENKKREKKGKAKYHQYYDIVIETRFGEEKTLNDAKNPIKGISSGTKAPHLRRGHIRHYEGKNVWIEATFVNAHKGTPKAKTYRIK